MNGLYFNTQTRFRHCQALTDIHPQLAILRARLHLTSDPAARVEAEAYLDNALDQIANLDDPDAAERIRKYLGKAKDVLARPVTAPQQEPQAEPESEEIQQRRSNLKRSRESKLYRTALHEAGHCLACLVNGVRIDHALVRQDLSGQVVHYTEPDQQALREIVIAGAAAVSAFGFEPFGLDADHERLRSEGHLRPENSADLRQSVEKDVLDHRRFVSGLADELWVHCGQEISGERIGELWRQFK